MKYLIVLALVGLLFWKWQAQSHGRLQQRKPPHKVPKQDTPAATPMQACALCGLNVPLPEAVQGHSGWYCCSDHRQRAEP